MCFIKSSNRRINSSNNFAFCNTSFKKSNILVQNQLPDRGDRVATLHAMELHHVPRQSIQVIFKIIFKSILEKKTIRMKSIIFEEKNE